MLSKTTYAGDVPSAIHAAACVREPIPSLEITRASPCRGGKDFWRGFNFDCPGQNVTQLLKHLLVGDVGGKRTGDLLADQVDKRLGLHAALHTVVIINLVVSSLLQPQAEQVQGFDLFLPGATVLAIPDMG